MIDNPYCSFNCKSHKSGNAIVEYAMPSVVLLCLCIAGLTAISVNFKQVISLMKGQMSQQISNTEAEKILHDQARARFVMLQNISPRHQYLGSNAYSMVQSTSDPNSLCSGQWCVSAPGLTGNVVNTAGTNGQVASLTNSAANIYTQMAKKLEAEGKDPSLVTLLTNMANLGHNIGNAENTLDDPVTNYNSISTGVNTIKTGREDFKRLSGQLSNVIMDLPEESRGLVTDASTVITTIADNYSFSGSIDASGGQISYNYTASSAQLTHSGANTICRNGGNTSQCLH